MDEKQIRAISLFSGGLDSILATRLLMQQGIWVIGAAFISPFFGPQLAQRAAQQLNIELIINDITRPLLEIVKNPRYGYGQVLNPCIDCHALMLKEAAKIMKAKGYHFIFTGEVLNERPMSQNRKSLALVARISQVEDFILRPLSAKLLKITQPELNGWVNRDMLLDIQGRSRKKQIALAKEFNITDYPNPAGGCLLTDIEFCKRLKELFRYKDDPTDRDIELLKIGRHFHLSKGAWLIIGRNKQENELLEKKATAQDFILITQDVPGPVGFLKGEKKEAILDKAAQLCAAYSDAQHGSRRTVITRQGKNVDSISVRVEKKIAKRRGVFNSFALLLIILAVNVVINF